MTDREQRLQRSLERYTREVWRESAGDGDSARLAMTVLRKRALSSAAAALDSLVRRLHLLQDRTPQPRQLSLLDDDDGLERDDAVPDATLGAPGLRDADREHMTLRRLIECAARAANGESKIDWLRRFLRRINGEPVLIFTEYRDTLARLSSLVEGALQLHGALPASERVTLQQRFNAQGGILLATDAASCGLNLHERCRLVVNFELPWNPARLEQRIGRVDRISQRRTVHAVTLVARDTAEALVVAPLVRRLFRVAATLGERDRMTSFLTDARTAGIVMGGAPEPSAEEAAAPSLPEAPELEPVSIDVGARLTAAASAAYARNDGDPIVASAIRASPLIDQGIAVVIETTAATNAGDLVGRRVVVLQRRGLERRPRNPAEVRRRAQHALDSLAEPLAARASETTARWFSEIEQIHQTAVDRRLAREEALLANVSAGAAFQPGLFDNRAARAFEARAAAEESIESEHQIRLSACRLSRELRLRHRVSAVLIVWS
ncbi:MAG TPA: helicase-related protein [Vicinamibacterales bacterium]